MNTKIIFLITFLIFLASCTTQNTELSQESDISGEVNNKEVKDYTFTKVITYEDENSTVILTLNKITKKASVDMGVYMNQSELQNEFMDLTNLTINMMCGLMNMAFFNESAMTEFNEQMNSWSSMNATVEDDSPEKNTELEENPLEGYNITKVNIKMLDKISRKEISSCTITGPKKEDMLIKIN